MKKLISLPLVLSGVGLLLSCSNNAVAKKGMLYAPSEIEKSLKISEKGSSVYQNFVDVVVPRFFETFGEDDLSICLSLPDLFLCYNIMAVLSETSLQEAYLSEIGAENMEELASVSKELIPFFCYASENNGTDSGAFNLNGLFFDPELVLKDDADARFKSIAESYNGYVFNQKPTTELVDSWIREADKEGYLSDVSTPEVPEEAVVTTVSSYAVVDPFEKDVRESFETVYREGSNRVEYTLADGSKKMVDCLSFHDTSVAVEYGENYVAPEAYIETSSIKAYYPEEGVSLSSLADSIFSDKEKTTKYFAKSEVNIPMFDVASSISSHPSALIPSFSAGIGTGFFETNGGISYGASLAQNNHLTLDYNGFKGASITMMSTTTSYQIGDTFHLEIDRPFIFEIDRYGLPLYYGQINDPGYPQA